MNRFYRKPKPETMKKNRESYEQIFKEEIKWCKDNLQTLTKNKHKFLTDMYLILVTGSRKVTPKMATAIKTSIEKCKNNPNFLYQEAQNQIAGPDFGLDLANIASSDLDITAKEALEQYTRNLADEKERRHLELLENPLTQARSAPEFTKQTRDDYSAQLNQVIDDPANYRLIANFLKRTDREFGSREEHRTQLQAGVDRARTKRTNFEADLRALRDVPRVTIGDTSYLEAVSFRKVKDIQWGKRAEMVEEITIDLMNQTEGAFGEFDTFLYKFNPTLSLPRDEKGFIESPKEGPYFPFRDERFWQRDPQATGIEDIQVLQIVGKNKDGSFAFEKVDLEGRSAAEFIAPDIATVMTEIEAEDIENAKKLHRSGKSITEAATGFRDTYTRKIEAARRVVSRNLFLNEDEDGFIYIPLTEDKKITRLLPSEHWWAHKLNNEVFERRLEQGAGALELVDMALEQEESDTTQMILEATEAQNIERKGPLGEINPAFTEEYREELQTRLDTINEAKRGPEGQPKNPAIYAAEVLKFLIAPEIFGAYDIVGQPVVFKLENKKEGISEDKVYDVGALKQKEKEELYQEYYNIFKRRNAELEALIYPQGDFSTGIIGNPYNPKGLTFP